MMESLATHQTLIENWTSAFQSFTNSLKQQCLYLLANGIERVTSDGMLSKDVLQCLLNMQFRLFNISWCSAKRKPCHSCCILWQMTKLTNKNLMAIHPCTHSKPGKNPLQMYNRFIIYLVLWKYSNQGYLIKHEFSSF